MEPLLSTVVNDLFSRALSMVIHKYQQSKGAEGKLRRLQRLLLRIRAIVEEAEGRHITNQAMLRQLQLLREGMYRGNYMLDGFRYQDHQDSKAQEDEVSGRLFAFSRINTSMRTLVHDVGSLNELEKMLESLDKMIGDLKEFVLFLNGYPPICREPYSAYLVIDKVMFGRQFEMETIINFLLQRDAVGDGTLGVLPIIGPARVGKSTLVEHVCLDERVRDQFSLIVFFNGDDFYGGNLASLRDSGVIKHQKLPPTTHGKSLVVIELTTDMDEETWKSVYSSGVNHMAHGSKLIVTSRSENVAAFGTTRALKLEFLSQDAYWYLFKAITFGSTNPEDQPVLAAIGMEIAAQLKGTFLGANVYCSILRANLNTQFWCAVLRCLRHYTRKHLLLFGEHPMVLLGKDRRIYSWAIAKKSKFFMVHDVYQECFPRDDVPRITAQDLLFGTVPSQGRFDAVVHRSRIPPCYTYLASYILLTTKHKVLSKRRCQHESI